MTRGLVWTDLELGQALGEGQVGRVHQAQLCRPFGGLDAGASVVVKMYKTWVFEQPGQMERILRELQIGREVLHPNLVQTVSLVSTPEGRPALVMRHYKGNTLEADLMSRRRNNTPYSWCAAVEILRALVSAVVALHDHGVIHRDIKPANVLITSEGPILMDLGVVQSTAFPEQTTTGAFLGTIRYAAPEYLFGENYDCSIDVFSIGAIAYELLVGETFRGDETHWARLVIKAASTPRPSYSLLARQHGMNATEYVRFVLDSILDTSQRLTARQLLECLDPRYLDEP